MYLRKYRLASNVYTKAIEQLSSSDLFQVFNAIMEAKLLQEELLESTNGVVKKDVSALLCLIESEKFKSIPNLKKYLQSQLETQ